MKQMRRKQKKTQFISIIRNTKTEIEVRSALGEMVVIGRFFSVSFLQLPQLQTTWSCMMFCSKKKQRNTTNLEPREFFMLQKKNQATRNIYFYLLGAKGILRGLMQICARADERVHRVSCCSANKQWMNGAKLVSFNSMHTHGETVISLLTAVC